MRRAAVSGAIAVAAEVALTRWAVDSELASVLLSPHSGTALFAVAALGVLMVLRVGVIVMLPGLLVAVAGRGARPLR